MTTHEMLAIALEHHRAGRRAEAEGLYRQIIAADPKQADALHGLGLLCFYSNRAGEAVELLGRAVVQRPGEAQFQMNLGAVLGQSGRLAESIAAYRAALAIRPHYPQALSNLGNTLRLAGQIEPAIEACTQAVALQPEFAAAHGNLGAALQAAGRFAEAVAAYRQCVELAPKDSKTMYQLANLYREMGNKDQAIVFVKRVLDLHPDFSEAHGNLGNLLCDLGRVDEGVDHLRRAAQLRPDAAESLNNLAYGLFHQGRLLEGIATLERAWDMKPDHAEIGSNAVFVAHYHPDYDAQTILKKCRLWNQRHAEPLQFLITPHHNDRDANRRLRVGYVSADFWAHCQAMFTPPLLSNHDHSQFEIFCYSSVATPDGITRRLRQYADRWREVRKLSFSAVADAVRADQIDILVDLSMHSAGARPTVFACKPAPVQATWLAYPGTTGMTAMDYRLTDPYLDPPGEDEDCFSERTVRLPDTYWCYDPLTVMEESDAPPSPLPAEKNGLVTFGCLNNISKLNPGTLALWARVLMAMPSSRLRLLAAEGEARRGILETLAQHGVAAGRVDFVPRQKRPEYLAEFARIDLCLDTLPYNGHTTSLDSMWLGVPVVTRVGRTVVGRAGLSQLSNLKLTELVAYDDDQFVKIATELASDVPRLAELRRTLRQRMKSSPLCDGPRFARGVEAVYRQIWRVWCGDK